MRKKLYYNVIYNLRNKYKNIIFIIALCITFILIMNIYKNLNNDNRSIICFDKYFSVSLYYHLEKSLAELE